MDRTCKQTESLPKNVFFFFFCYSRKVIVAFVYFCLIVVSVIPLEQKERSRPGFSCCWLVHDPPCKKISSKLVTLSGEYGQSTALPTSWLAQLGVRRCVYLSHAPWAVFSMLDVSTVGIVPVPETVGGGNSLPTAFRRRTHRSVSPFRCTAGLC